MLEPKTGEWNLAINTRLHPSSHQCFPFSGMILLYNKASCNDTFLFVPSHHFFAGDSALLDVSLEHDNVQRGQPIEINVQQMLLDAKEEAFVRTECGFSLGPRILIPFVKMAKPTRTFSVVKSSQYKNRIKIFGNFTIIVKNATFQDEGTTFYCQLSFVYMKDTQHFTDDIVKYVKLKNVYGK